MVPCVAKLESSTLTVALSLSKGVYRCCAGTQALPAAQGYGNIVHRRIGYGVDS